MLRILQEQVYGFLPPPPDSFRFTEAPYKEGNFAAGKATLRSFTLTVGYQGKEHSFPVNLCLPAKEGKHPFYVLINFRPQVPDRYYPTEEIIDEGFGVFSFCYLDVCQDNEDFTDGLAALFCKAPRSPHAPGKIALWAWAAMRVLDLAERLEGLDLSRAAVCGHSRLGKTALLAAALDERFSFAHSNDSGCSGAALAKHKKGERIADITRVFPFWFCPAYESYAEKDEELPFDQHWLLGSIAPRKLLVTSANGDGWAHPEHEFLSCFYAQEAWGLPAESPDFPPTHSLWGKEHLFYSRRDGKHYFSREDWRVSLELRKEKGI